MPTKEDLMSKSEVEVKQIWNNFLQDFGSVLEDFTRDRLTFYLLPSVQVVDFLNTKKDTNNQ